MWGPRYVDELVERDRDTTDNGSFDERFYGMQDGNWNVSSIANTTGGVQERYGYSPYGAVTVLAPAFVLRSLSSYQWGYYFSGYRLDAELMGLNARNRVLTPSLSWLQRDMAGYVEGPNLYEYARSNPISLTDAFGLNCDHCLAQYRRCRAGTRNRYLDCMEALGEPRFDPPELPGLPSEDPPAPNNPNNVFEIMLCELRLRQQLLTCEIQLQLCLLRQDPMFLAMLAALAVLAAAMRNLIATLRSGIGWLIRNAATAFWAAVQGLANAGGAISIFLCMGCCTAVPEACGGIDTGGIA